jgi:periplasmic divalent cation tolerance protein
MSNVHVLFSTVESNQQAERIASKVVAEHLAACVNILPGVSSFYRWKGEIQQTQESLLILKTPTDRVRDLMDRVKELHPYEVPEIISISVEEGYQPYLNWIQAETKR